MSLFNSRAEPMKHTYDAAFEQAYAAYPRHIGKDAAAKAWKAAIAREQPTVILAAVVAFASSPAGRLGRLTPHFSTWLNAGRWQDDQTEWRRGSDPKMAAKEKADENEALYKQFCAMPKDRQDAAFKWYRAKHPESTMLRRDVAITMMRRINRLQDGAIE